ncbi:MAG: M23 family metallopeptidase [Cyanobacteriota bacterium]|nr:M23 family metallopeptidase [Cyanobacteriota bacterium]
MDAALSMPWGCSDPLSLVRQRGVWLLAGVLWIPAWIGAASPAQARNPWSLGVFPVSPFVAYTSHFGTRSGPAGRPEPHHGLDIAAPLGSPVRSWWGGVVQEVIRDGVCGVGLVIRSGAYEHIYCHLAGGSEAGVYRSGGVRLRRGEPVRTGQLIGHVGLSGRTTGPHLHWGLRHRGQWLDPAAILRAMAAGR